MAIKILKGIVFTLLSLVALIVLGIAALYVKFYFQSNSNLAQLGPPAPTLTVNGQSFRDLNKNGRLDVYEDSTQSVEARVEDLLQQMTLAEKAGTMFINFTPVGAEGELVERPDLSDPMTLVFSMNSELLASKKMNHFSLLAVVDEPSVYIDWHNKMQLLSERTRLGIPSTFASDPRNGAKGQGSISLPSGAFSKWPEPLGLAAIRDPDVVQHFANIARQEYRAVGIHLALHPVADLATEPRWSRISGTFGEDAHLSAKLVAAYVKGMQGEKLGPDSVATMVKHFSGGGPQMDGEDAHFAYGKEQVYPGNNFGYHLIPFEQGAFPAGAAQIMPYYGIPVGQTSEDVGFSYNKEIITGLLREKYQFDGVVCTDWGLISDAKMLGALSILEARAWGVEGLTPQQRMLKLLDAGIDQFGGEELPEMLIQLVDDGKVSEARLDESVRRLLRDKFRLGLFDNPYTDLEFAESTVGREEFVAAGLQAQQKSLVLLKNGKTSNETILPLSGKLKLYVENIEPEIASNYGELVTQPEQADIAILRMDSPYEKRSGLVESVLRAGDLRFEDEEKKRILNILNIVPSVVSIYLDRGIVIPDISAASTALVADFGADDTVVMDMIFGEFSPQGKLPIELPSSMEAVRQQYEDVPYDSKKPLYPYGYGLSY